MVKFRNGFVSNSSSTSFVIFGGKTTNTAENRKQVLLKFFTIEELDRICQDKYQKTFDEQNDADFYDLYYDTLEGKMKYSIIILDNDDLVFGKKFDVDEYANTEVYDISEIVSDLVKKLDGEIKFIIGSEAT